MGGSQEVYYSAIKGAQISFVKALAKEVGQSSVRVNAVSPGFIESKMNGHLSLKDTQDYLKDVPLGRLGTPKDVAKTVLFLCHKDAQYIHGEVIRVNGGQLT
nr:SDR family oxidoreductase [Piscibacillus salipiscarius]